LWESYDHRKDGFNNFPERKQHEWNSNPIHLGIKMATWHFHLPTMECSNGCFIWHKWHRAPHIILLVCDTHVHHTFFTCSSNINITICINMEKLQTVQFAKEKLKAFYVLTYNVLGLIAI
jgi:hypothetical protein